MGKGTAGGGHGKAGEPCQRQPRSLRGEARETRAVSEVRGRAVVSKRGGKLEKANG